MSHVFISYKTDNRDYVAPLAETLKKNGYKVWLDAASLPGSADWEDEIQAALEAAYAVMIVMTTAAHKSEWVRREKNYAEKIGKPIVPLWREGDIWFGVNNIQVVDARRCTPEDPVPPSLYTALQQYAPRELGDSLLVPLKSGDPRQQRRVLPELIEIARNPYNPQRVTARQWLQRLTKSDDPVLVERVQATLDELPPPTTDEIHLPDLVNGPSGTSRRGLLRLILVVGLVVVSVLAVFLVNQPMVTYDPTMTDTASPTRAPTGMASPTTLSVAVNPTFTVTASPTVPPSPTAKPSKTPMPTRTATPAPTLAPGTTRVDDKGVKQVWVPAGCFQMGSDPVKAPKMMPDEAPQHLVCLTKGYWIDQFEVTNAAYQVFLDAGGYATRDYWTDDGWAWLQKQQVKAPVSYPGFTDPQQPRVGVSWYEAQAYAKWRGAALPREAQWEYAARGPQAMLYPWGDTYTSGLAAVDERKIGGQALEKTALVGSYEKGKSWVNAYDMAGNVWEWTADWYDPKYYNGWVKDDPPGPSEGKMPVARGGAWMADPDPARAAFRNNIDPARQENAVGFRCVTAVP